MKTLTKLLALLLILGTVLCAMISCTPTPDSGSGDGTGDGTDNTQQQWVDYVSSLKLDMSTDSLKINATVKSFIDGDTTHFYVDKSVCEDGILKARYLAINTPESTGKIEPWGKAASNFTRSKLEGAVSIILESDNTKWNIDSTGERHLVWVWYKSSEDAEYRNLNLEILQEGYAIASNASQNRYGELCTAAIAQSLANQLYVYSKEKDPDYPYGDAVELTLKELRQNIADYEGQRVAFNAVVTMNDGGSILAEAYDEEDGIYYGMTVYYGTSGLSPAGKKLLTAGYELRIVGVVTYWEKGGVYQVSDLQYNARDKENPKYIALLSEGHETTFVETDVETFRSKLSFTDEEGVTVEYDYANLVMNTSISMKNLVVKSMYTTKEGDSAGAITLTCEVDGQTVKVRTSVLRDSENNVITEEYFEGRTIDVQGFVDYFSGEYQIQVYSVDHITLH